MIKLSKIYIEDTEEGKSKLIAPIQIDNQEKQIIWFEVSSEFSEYLCCERCDAFVVGILNYAMKNGHDIYFETPISEELFYNLDRELLDVMSKTGKGYTRIKLNGVVSNAVLSKAKAIGTGISCGVDSFFTLSNHDKESDNVYPITHLAFNNVGSHGEGKKAYTLYTKRIERSRTFAKEHNYTFIESNSNIQDVIPQNHYLTHTYTSIFAVLCMQKLYMKYFYSSSVELKDFSFKNSDLMSPGHYEYFLLKSFSINGLAIYSEGANASRIDKTKQIVNYAPSYNYLNVCIPQNNNCGRCEKCLRTLLGLEAVEGLDKYEKVFDLQVYKNHRLYNYAFLYKNILLRKEDYLGIYQSLSSKVNLFHKGYGTLLYLKDISLKSTIKMVRLLPKGFQGMLKNMYHKYHDR